MYTNVQYQTQSEVAHFATISSILRAAIDYREAQKIGSRDVFLQAQQSIQDRIPELHDACFTLGLLGALQRVTALQLDFNRRVSIERATYDPHFYGDRANLNGHGLNVSLDLPSIGAVVHELVQRNLTNVEFQTESERLLQELGIREELRLFVPKLIDHQPFVHLERG